MMWTLTLLVKKNRSGHKHENSRPRENNSKHTLTKLAQCGPSPRALALHAEDSNPERDIMPLNDETRPFHKLATHWYNC
jgi:hypothetical protein